MKKILCKTVAVILVLVMCLGVFAGCTISEDESYYDSSMGSSISENFDDGADKAIKDDYVKYSFRNDNLLEQHYYKHGKEMGFASPEEYEDAASDVINNPDALSKTEAEDGDQVFYVEDTNEFVVLSTDGYIRTYFNPDRGIDYYNKQ